MRLLIDAGWRAALYCLHPRVIALSVLPLLLMVVLALAFGYFFWDAAIQAVQLQLDSVALFDGVMRVLERFGAERLRLVVAPLIVLFLAIPAIAMVSLLTVAWLMTPSIVALVAQRRFPTLKSAHGDSLLGSLGWSLGATVLALLVTVVSMPLWLIPPLVLVLPPLIWGWLTYRVMAYDVLSGHASADERRTLIERHRGTLLGMGVLCGYLGAAPSVVWASGAMFIVMAPVLVPVAIWIYTLVFAFSALWFSHYALAALQALRREQAAAPVDVAARVIAEPVGAASAEPAAPAAPAMALTHDTGAPPSSFPKS